MINKVTLIGNLGRDPELRRLESGAAVAKFSVATTESYRDDSGGWRDSTEWHDVVLWRQLAERAESQLRKGMLIYVEGKLSTRSWQDKDGNPRKTTEVVASYFRILNRREGEGSGANATRNTPAANTSDANTQSAAPAAKIATAEAAPAAPPAMDNSSDDSDLPF